MGMARPLRADFLSQIRSAAAFLRCGMGAGLSTGSGQAAMDMGL